MGGCGVSASIQIPFKVGEEVWYSVASSGQKTVKCPDCAGQLFSIVTLGNGESHKLKCHACGPGYTNPNGFIVSYKTTWVPERRTPIEFTGFRDGIAMYSDAVSCGMSADRMFSDLQACEDDCDRRQVQSDAEEEARMLANIRSKRESLAFSVSYWRSQVREYEEKLARVREQLGISIEKARKP